MVFVLQTSFSLLAYRFSAQLLQFCSDSRGKLALRAGAELFVSLPIELWNCPEELEQQWHSQHFPERRHWQRESCHLLWNNNRTILIILPPVECFGSLNRP